MEKEADVRGNSEQNPQESVNDWTSAVRPRRNNLQSRTISSLGLGAREQRWWCHFCVEDIQKEGYTWEAKVRSSVLDMLSLG